MATKNALNFWLDVVSLLVMLGLALTGGLMHYVLPPGTGHSHALFGLGRHDIGHIHFYFAVSALILVAVHVWLHWRWICCVAGRRSGDAEPSRRARSIWGLVLAGAIVLVLCGSLVWASGRIERNAGVARGQAGRGFEQATVSPVAPSAGERPDLVEGGDATPEPAPSSAASLARPMPRGPGHEKHDEDCPAGAAINGRITLSEAAAACRLSVARLQSELKLSANVDPNERLGRLKRWYGLSIHEVRRLACR